MTESSSGAWLTLDEAAERLGVSRLRLRQAITANAIPAQRDNQRFWRLTLPDDLAAVRRSIESAKVPSQGLIDLLFDEIEDLNALLGERAANEQRLAALAGHQQELLERALSLAENAGGGAAVDIGRVVQLNERSGHVLERSLASLEAKNAELATMTGLMDRALTTVAGLDAEVTRGRAVTDKQQAFIERLFTLAQENLDRLLAAPRRGLFGRIRARVGRAPGERASPPTLHTK
jgi:excisionase family DNA binding protein